MASPRRSRVGRTVDLIDPRRHRCRTIRVVRGTVNSERRSSGRGVRHDRRRHRSGIRSRQRCDALNRQRDPNHDHAGAPTRRPSVCVVQFSAYFFLGALRGARRGEVGYVVAGRRRLAVVAPGFGPAHHARSRRWFGSRPVGRRGFEAPRAPSRRRPRCCVPTGASPRAWFGAESGILRVFRERRVRRGATRGLSSATRRRQERA